MEKYITGFAGNQVVGIFVGDDPQWAIEHGYIKADVEQGWDGQWYRAGTQPLVKPTEVIAEEVRAKRNSLLREHCDILTPLRYNALTDDEKQAWTEYRQALLDLPQLEGFPWDGKDKVPWPKIPGQEVEAETDAAKDVDSGANSDADKDAALNAGQG